MWDTDAVGQAAQIAQRMGGHRALEEKTDALAYQRVFSQALRRDPLSRQQLARRHALSAAQVGEGPAKVDVVGHPAPESGDRLGPQRVGCADRSGVTAESGVEAHAVNSDVDGPEIQMPGPGLAGEVGESLCLSQVRGGVMAARITRP